MISVIDQLYLCAILIKNIDTVFIIQDLALSNAVASVEISFFLLNFKINLCNKEF